MYVREAMLDQITHVKISVASFCSSYMNLKVFEVFEGRKMHGVPKSTENARCSKIYGKYYSPHSQLRKILIQNFLKLINKMHQQKKTKRLFTYQCILPHRVFLNWQCLYLPKTSQYAGLLKIEYEHEMYYTESKREQRTSEKRDIGKTRRQNSKTSHFPITYKLTVYLSIMVYLSVVVQRVVE